MRVLFLPQLKIWYIVCFTRTYIHLFVISFGSEWPRESYFELWAKQMGWWCYKFLWSRDNKSHAKTFFGMYSVSMHQYYDDVIMTTIASQITSLMSVYSTVYSDADQSKHQSSASLAFVWGIHRDRWIPRTKGQLRGKCFHLMTSSWTSMVIKISRCWS